MSEYTAYSAVHIDDMKTFREELTKEGDTAAIDVGSDHPCYQNPKSVNELWKGLSYQQKWAIVVSTKPISSLPLVKVWADITVNEDREGWRFDLATSSQTLELLFSKQPWGDYSDPDPEKDRSRIHHAQHITEEDFGFMEKCFSLPRKNFEQFLKIGKVYEFLRSVGLPAEDMFDQYRFSDVLEVVRGRVVLWDELAALAD